MKIFNVLLRSALFVGFAFTCSSLSCDLFDKADDISFTTDFEKSFDVVDANNTYAETITLDATTDPEVEKYKEKIQDITVNKITYRISGFRGLNDANISGDVLFGPNGSLGTVTIPSTNLSSSTEEIELDLSQEEVDEISNQLKNDKKVTVTMSGTVENGPVDFTITFKVDAKITANAL